MATSKNNYRIRKIHRFLGVTLGIQFLLWTIGGLYFSWSDLDEVHGDYQKAHIHPLSIDIELASLDSIISVLHKQHSAAFILEAKLIQILDQPYYQIIYSQSHNGKKSIQLVDAKNGALRPGLTEKEATDVAIQAFNGNATVVKSELITSTNGHHEYREQPLPAYAIAFDHPSKTTVYVSKELGTVQKFRNEKWRTFDFLWMMHTMGYKDRDHFANYLLRFFSIFGLCTILSGFTLFFVSRKKPIVKK